MTNHEQAAKHHLEQATKWMPLTESGQHFDPVRDHTTIALTNAVLALLHQLQTATQENQ